MSTGPRRADGMEVNEVADGFVVYDAARRGPVPIATPYSATRGATRATA